jgi:N-acetylmuramoyl-L-alanine amidase
MRERTVLWTRRLLLLVIGALVVGGLWSARQVVRAGKGPTWLQSLLNVTETVDGLRVGIIAGHSGNDAGTVCPDGLTEAEVNLATAARVAESLTGQGIQVDVLEEFDSRLRDYRANALVSIHADSCNAALSGFKVAAPEGGVVGGAASERLATCLWDRYEAATGLPRHPETITRDMTRYHAFREISIRTPAAIIEIGFLGTDRELLTKSSERVAAGIVAGIQCFLSPEP